MMKKSSTFLAFAMFLVIYILLETGYFSSTLYHHRIRFAQIQTIPDDGLNFCFVPYGVLAYIILVLSMWNLIFENGHALRHVSYGTIIKRSTWYALAVYGTCNLTNMSAISRYRLDMLMVDTLWGLFVMNTTSLLTALLYRRFIDA